MGRKLLIVEDDLELQQVLATHLMGCGFEVFCCANGVEAAAKYQKHSPDLVLLDLMLPRLNGLDFLRLIRAKEAKGKKTKEAVVMVITGSVDTELTDLAAKLGSVEILTKPFALEDLERMSAAQQPLLSVFPWWF